MIAKSITNLAIRSATLLSKFLLIAGITKFLAMEDLGEYGLFSSTLTLALLLLGFDFYRFNTRELLSKEPVERMAMIRDQFVFHGLCYLIGIPVLLGIILMGGIPVKYTLWFFSVLFFEHFSRELYRLLATLHHPIAANIFLFFREGLWAYVILVLWMIPVNGTQNLNVVWIGWFIGAAVCFFLSLFFLLRLELGKARGISIDWAWIGKGMLISLPFLIGTLAHKSIEYSNRYFVEHFLTTADVGILTFFTGIGNQLNIVIYTTVTMIYMPRLIELYQRGSRESFTKDFKKFIMSLFFYTFGFSAFLYLATPPLLAILGKKELITHLNVLLVVLVANAVFNFTFVPQLWLYIKKMDLWIMGITLAGLAVNLLANYVFIQKLGLIGAAWASVTGFLFIGLAKAAVSMHRSRPDNRNPDSTEGKTAL